MRPHTEEETVIHAGGLARSFRTRRGTVEAVCGGDTPVAPGCDLLRDPVGVRRRIGYVGQAGGAGPDCPALDELVLRGACTACRRSAPTSVAMSCSVSSSSPAPRRAQTDPRGRHR